MKYIRTKDGQIVKHPHPDAQVFTFRYEIEKSADTIGELCDCFIKIKRKNNYKDYILKFDYKDLEELKKQFVKFPQSPVYGAIHIEDKGLIYKAKMKGILPDGKIEWELL